MKGRIDDDGLVEQFLQGDETAFDRIIHRYSADAGQLAHRLLGWPGDVEDVVQDVFLAAYLHLKKFQGQCRLKTWLFTITINKCRSVQRRQILRFRYLKRMQQNKTHESPSYTTYDEDRRESVQKAVFSLPRYYREVIVLHYLHELSMEQICDILK